MPERVASRIMSVSAEWLHEQIMKHLDKEMLMVDLRCQKEFLEAHLSGSINMTLPSSSLMLRRLAKGALPLSSCIPSNKSRRKWESTVKKQRLVVLIDSNDSLPSNAIDTVQKRLSQDSVSCTCVYLLDGFSTFFAKFPSLCSIPDLCSCSEEKVEVEDDNDCQDDSTISPIIGLQNLRIEHRSPNSEKDETPDSSCEFPVEILPYLYLGNAKNSRDLDTLKKHNIKYILNVTPNLPNVFEGNGAVKYMQIPINDHWSQNLYGFFPEAIEFIDNGRREKVGVLVHCLAGISRSVTVTVAYLMQACMMSLNDAYDFVRQRKSNISPNFNFMGQLLDFERALNPSPACSDCTCSPSSDADQGNCSCRRSPEANIAQFGSPIGNKCGSNDEPAQWSENVSRCRYS